MTRFATLVMAGGGLLIVAGTAGAQPLGSFRWQLHPYCNVLTLRVEQKGGVYLLEGTDDQCGAPNKAGVTGLAFLNPSGQIGLGLSTVTSPGATPVHLDIALTLPSLNGTWTDSAGNGGTFTFTPGVGTGGSPRPVPPSGLPAGSITATHLAPGSVGVTAIDPAQVQRRVAPCPSGAAVQSINGDGSVVCQPTASPYNVFTDPAANFVGIGRNFRISGNEVFGIRAPTVANDYGGMYVETTNAGGWPFYGFATNGSFRSWTYYNGTTGGWHLYNAGTRLTVQNEGHVVIGPYADPPSPALGGLLELRSLPAIPDLLRAHEGANLRFRITNAGNVTADGTFSSPAADFAELLPTESETEPGDVLTIGPDGRLEASARPYQSTVAGVHSTKPAFLGGDRGDAAEPGRAPLAVMGVVPVKASTENGPIRPGDLLTTSSLAGHAMRCEGVERCFGRTLGKALTALTTQTGVITVLVMLQ